MRTPPVLRDALLVGSLLIGSSGLLIVNQPRRFDALDTAAFMDAGWRILTGQVPYVDFTYNAGPVQPYLHALFFALFGFGRTAMLAHILTVNLIVVTATWVLARRRFSPGIATLCTALSGVAFAGPIAQPWYDHTAWMWVILSLVAFDYRERAPRVSSLLAGAGVALAFMTKANVGLAGGAALGMAYLISATRRSWRPPVWYVLGGLVTLAALMFSLADQGRFIDEVFVTYAPARRLLSLGKLTDMMLYLPYFPLALTLWVTVLRGGWRQLERVRLPLALASGVAGASLFAVWTGSLFPPGYTITFGVVLIYVLETVCALDVTATSRAVRRPLLRALWVAGTWSGLFVFASVSAFFVSVWSWRVSNLNSTYAMRSPSMAGWYASPAVGQGIDDMVSYLNAHVPREDSLFVFPDTTLIYGLTGHLSYAPAPFIYFMGEFPAPGRYTLEFRTHFLADPPRWIVLHDDAEVTEVNTRRFLESLQLDAVLATRYTEVARSGTYSVLQLNEAANPKVDSAASIQPL